MTVSEPFQACLIASMRPNQLALDKAVAAACAAAEAGDFQTAAAAFQAAIRLDHGDAALHEQHAQCLMELGQYDDAAKAAAQATTLRPAVSTDWMAKRTPMLAGFCRFCMLLASMLLAGHVVKAVLHCPWTLGCCMQWPEAWLTLARSLLNAGELQGAHQACTQCLVSKPATGQAAECGSLQALSSFCCAEP